MKKVLLAAFLFLFVLSCKKQETKTDFDISYTIYKSFKKTSGNSYQYTTSFASWVGISGTTTITVENGKVTKREYTQYQQNPAGPGKTVIKSWTETLTDLNTHPEGDRGITLDEVYEKARSQWLKVSSKNNAIYFETGNAGMISSCGYVPNNCADDCFTGIIITGIKAL